jgi:hypothetical protein
VPERLIAESSQRAALQVVDVRDFQSQLAVWMLRGPVLGPLAAAIEDVGAAVRAILGAKPA